MEPKWIIPIGLTSASAGRVCKRSICLDLHCKPRQCITIPSRSLMVLYAKATIDKHMEGGLHKVVPNFLLSDKYPELVLIPTVHNVEINK